MIRDLKASDINIVKGFDKKGIILPDFKRKDYIGKIVQDEKGQIVACGIMWPIIEVYAIINEELPLTARTKAVIGLVEEMKRTNIKVPLHAWCATPEMEALLFKLGFRPSRYRSVIYGE
jgi:hypothetical protein